MLSVLPPVRRERVSSADMKSSPDASAYQCSKAMSANKASISGPDWLTLQYTPVE